VPPGIRERQEEAIGRAAGCWNDPDQAQLDSDGGIEAYLDETRLGCEERFKRIWKPAVD
jgi:hypothetical protein